MRETNWICHVPGVWNLESGERVHGSWQTFSDIFVLRVCQVERNKTKLTFFVSVPKSDNQAVGEYHNLSVLAHACSPRKLRWHPIALFRHVNRARRPSVGIRRLVDRCMCMYSRLINIHELQIQVAVIPDTSNSVPISLMSPDSGAANPAARLPDRPPTINRARQKWGHRRIHFPQIRRITACLTHRKARGEVTTFFRYQAPSI